MKQNCRNPLGVAFGSVCRLERKTLDISTEAMAHKLGIKPSFYKLVENGANYLHTNKSPAIVTAFNRSMSLDGVSKMLLAISHSEASARSLVNAEGKQTSEGYLKGFQSSVEQLCQLDPNKLGRLLLPYRDGEIAYALATSSAKDAKAALKQHGLTAQAQEFLKHYDSLGQTDIGLQSSDLVKKIESVPSMYLDIFSDLANRLGNLPAKVGFEEMWRWEKENRHLFKEWWCLQDYIEKIISRENLERYHYNHLWDKNFQRGHILFMAPANNEELHYKFSAIIRDLLEKSIRGECAPEARMANAHSKLKSFNKALEKMRFKSLPTHIDDKTRRICEEILPKPYSAFWVFKLTDNSLVGFYAKVTGSDNTVRNMLTEGVSLDHRQTAQKLEQFKHLWKIC